MKKEYIKPFAWGAAAGAVVLLIVIFSAGWVVTASSAQTNAERIAAKAVIEQLAPIAIAQFMQDPDKKERLTELKGVDSWKRDEYVRKSGWVTMPGSKEPNRAIEDEVVDRLMKLDL